MVLLFIISPGSAEYKKEKEKYKLALKLSVNAELLAAFIVEAAALAVSEGSI